MQDQIIWIIGVIIITIIQTILVKNGKIDKASKLEEKKQKLILKMEKQHKATEEKFIKEEKKINELKEKNL